MSPSYSYSHSTSPPTSNCKEMRARSAIALLGLVLGGTGIGFSALLITGRLFDLALSPLFAIDAAINALAAAASSSLSASSGKSQTVGASPINEGALGSEPLRWHADRPATNQSDGNAHVDIPSPSPPFVTDIWDLTINFTDFVQREAIENAEALKHVQHPAADNATDVTPSEKALHWGNMALTGLCIGDGRCLTFSRIWFTRKATPTGGKAGNPDYSYLHVVERDEKMRAIPGTSRTINIPFGPAANDEDCCKGPEDARAFVGPCGSPLLVFNMDVPHRAAKGKLAIKSNVRAMHLYNHSSGDIVQLQIEGREKSKFEKNWTPFTHKGTIQFACSLAPLQTLRLDNPSKGTCTLVCIESDEKPQTLRMGTQFIELKDEPGTFLSLARVVGHATPKLRLVGGQRIYRPVFVLMKARDDNQFSIRFISGLVLFGERFFLSPFGSNGERKELTLGGTNIVVPSGLWKWDEENNESVFSVYTQDTHDFALRVEGLHAAVKRILSGNSTGLSPFLAIMTASAYGRSFAASTIATGGKSETSSRLACHSLGVKRNNVLMSYRVHFGDGLN